MPSDLQDATLPVITPRHALGTVGTILLFAAFATDDLWLRLGAMSAGVAMMGVGRWRNENHRLTVPVIAWLLVALAASRLLELFPCDIACQGGGYYHRVGPVPLMLPGLGAYLLLAVLATRDARRGGWCPWLVRLGWFLAGASLFFLAISIALGLRCPFCLLCHALTGALLACLAPFPRSVRWWHALSWLIAGALVMNALFHHTPVADVAAAQPQAARPTVTGPSTATMLTTAELDRGRTYGVRAARHTLEVVIDLTCGHCAEQYRPLMAALQPALAAKRVRVVVRHLVRPSQPASQSAAQLALAAAGLHQHATALEVLLGSNPDAGLPGLKARLGEVVDPARLDAALASDQAAIAALLADDQLRIGQLGLGPRTPSAVLLENDRVTRRWGGALPVADILAALDGGL